MLIRSLLLSLLIHIMFLFISIETKPETKIQHIKPNRIDVYLVTREANVKAKPIRSMPRVATRTPQVENKHSFSKKKSVEQDSKDLIAKSLAYARNSESAKVWTTEETSTQIKTPIEDLYIETWRLKVKAFGNLNYPVEAAKNKIDGHLTIVVVILSDGNLKDVYIEKPSGQKILDEAAIYFVRRTSPFAKFPKQMAERKEIIIKQVFIFQKASMD